MNLILGDGQLGSAIYKLTKWDYYSRKSSGFDANNPNFIPLKHYDTIINCIGYTDTYSKEREHHWKINYKFVADLVDFCSENEKKLVHISTDYVYANSKSGASEEDVPVHCKNWYGYTKLLGDGYVQLRSKDYLLIRCSFKPEPFPYPKAVVYQVGNFDSTKVIAELICKLINSGASGLYNVGTEPKTIFELAKKSNPSVEPMFGKIHHTMPTDITMDCSKMKKTLGGSNGLSNNCDTLL